MRPNLVLFALLAAVLATATHAAPPSPWARVAQAQSDIDLAPVVSDQQTTVVKQPVAAAIAPQPYAMGSYGYIDHQAARKCQCAQYFGGYGPLWETYCYEKRSCGVKGAAGCGCGQSTPCTSGCTTGIQPLFKGKKLYRGGCEASCCDQPACHTPRLRLPRRRKACGHVESGCDCAGPMTKQMEVAPDELGSPPAPEPSSDEQVAPPPPLNVEAAQIPSSRRSWTSQTAGLLPGH